MHRYTKKLCGSRVVLIRPHPLHEPGITHIAANRLRKYIRRFFGKVSKSAAIEAKVSLCLEHFKRMQTTPDSTCRSPFETGLQDAEEFIRLLLDCEQVHIVTARENYDAMKAKGDYDKAGIVLVDWASVLPDRQHFLWKNMICGKVMNANALCVYR